MFEVIGVVVVVWIGFVIIKSVIGGGIKGTLLRATHAAIEQGVPRDFSMASINNSEQLIRARKALAKENPKIGTILFICNMRLPSSPHIG